MVFVKQDLPDGKTNQGRVQAYDGPIYIADAALFVKATQPQLGIEDPYQLTETQYNAVLKVLRDQQPLIHRYWHDATVQMNDFKKRRGSRLQFVALSSQRPEGGRPAGRHRVPEGGGNRLGGYHHAAQRGEAPGLRL